MNSVVEGGIELVTFSDGRRRLVCETLQLAGGRVPAEETNRCVFDPAYSTPSTGGGWCVSNDPTVVGADCVASGSPETLRFFAMPQPGRELYVVVPKP